MRAWILGVSLLALAAGGFVTAQEKEKGKAGSPSTHTDHHLEKLVLPIALSPDPLVKWVLEAAKTPSAICRAGDFVFGGNPGAKFDSNWPESIRALTNYPLVLWELDAHLSYTARLGNAYRRQPEEIARAVNEVRLMAYDNGNLKTNRYQTVEITDRVITITPKDPKKIYVAYYDAEVVLYPRKAGQIRFLRGTMREPPRARRVQVEKDTGKPGPKGKARQVGYKRNQYPRPRYVYPNLPTATEGKMNRPAYPSAGQVWSGGYAVAGSREHYAYPLIHRPGYHPAYREPTHNNRYPYPQPEVAPRAYK